MKISSFSRPSMAVWVSSALAAGGLIFGLACFLMLEFQSQCEPDLDIDKGIHVKRLMQLLDNLPTEQSDRRIVAIRKYYRVIEIQFEARSASAQPDSLLYFDALTWRAGLSVNKEATGMSPAEIINVLQLIAQEPDDLVDKRILDIICKDGQIKIKTGITNYSAGGGGNSIRFEKRDGNWEVASWGSWLS